MRKIVFLLMALIINHPGQSQITIFYENFGNAGFRGPANTYTQYSSDASFFSEDSIAIHNWTTSVSDYDGASGQGFALCGLHDGNKVDLIVIGGINTEDYNNLELSFGASTWYGIASEFMEISYSTDGTNWVLMDDASLASGQYGNAAWGYVTLSEKLPSTENLYLMFHVFSTTQTVRFDDIEITGIGKDIQPPSQPANLQLLMKKSTELALIWKSSTDDNGISEYIVSDNGVDLAGTPDTLIKLRHLSPGQEYNLQVRAVDLAGNPSPESNSLIVSTDELEPGHEYSWEKQHALPDSKGDLSWDPRPFSFEPGNSVRYIDFEGGDDNNDGLTPSTAWKHHPWDNSAGGTAAAESGIHTYVFKRGVIYRGELTAKESGMPGDPVKLTSDPAWGSGEAMIFGSVRVTDGWIQADATTAPDMPEPEKVWYRDISIPKTNVVIEVSGDNMSRVRLARTPNYREHPFDPILTWHTMRTKLEDNTNNKLWLGDPEVFNSETNDYYVGGRIWAQEDANVMCTVWGQDITDYDAEKKIVQVNNQNFSGLRTHYYLENLPFLLDTVAEYYYDDDIDRLYLRLDGDRDPNTAIIEIARRDDLLKITDRHDIEVSGLTFGMTTTNQVRFGYGDVVSAIRLTGSCTDISIRNNKFVYVNGGVSGVNVSNPLLSSTAINITDNEFHVVDDLAITFSSGGDVYYDEVNILRNHIYDNGGRQRSRWYSSIPAIFGNLVTGEVAGNIVDISWGNGINMFWGKSGKTGPNVSIDFIRGFIHHNKASNTLIGTNDYGGIESWQGGPAYTYNNVSHNAMGYKHFIDQSIGYAYYFDGAFKQIVFNNISTGLSHQRSSAGYMQVLGYYNIYAHNLAYNSNIFLRGAQNDLALNGHNTYLSNIGSNTNTFFRHKIKPEYIPFESYGNNISSMLPFSASVEESGEMHDLDGFRSILEGYSSQLTQTGYNAAMPVLEDPSSFDFRPKADGEAIDRGSKFFTAFPLKSVVGEWNFYKHPADSTLVMADNFFMTGEFTERTEYQYIPKNHLRLHGLSDTSFVQGILEDWTTGAVYFDGVSYGSLSHAEASAHKTNNVDIDDENFILEFVFMADSASLKGPVVSKYMGAAGYEAGIDPEGYATLELFDGGTPVLTVQSAVKVNDGKWHHFLAEVNRNGKAVIYLNGENQTGSVTGSVPGPGISLSSTADLYVGKNMDDEFFRGKLDFLRISKGTLSEARTHIHELYTWQTDGPFLYDFTGTEPVGKRDAGPIEGGSKDCNFSVTSNLLEFDETSSSLVVDVITDVDYTIYSTTGEFFDAAKSGNQVTVTVEENEMFAGNEGQIVLYGCNSSEYISILQSGAPCLLSFEADTLRMDENEQTLMFEVEVNAPLDAYRNSSFFQVTVNESNDSIEVYLRHNPNNTRYGLITLKACQEEKTVVLEQTGELTGVFSLLPEGVEIYPNPVSNGLLNLRLPDDVNEFRMVVTDLSGQVHLTRELRGNSAEIDLELHPGLYHLQLIYGDENIKAPLMIVE